MGLKSGGRNLSFEILGFSQYDDVFHAAEADSDLTFVPDDKKRKNKKKKKKKKAKKNREGNAIHDESVISEDAIHDFSAIDADVGYTRTSAAIFPADVDSCPAAKSEGLRQRNVGFLMNGGNEELTVEDTGSCPRDDEANVDRENSPEIFTSDHVVELPRRTIEKEESLDWKKLMAKDPNETAPIEYSPMKYFMEEMYAGNSLRSTTSMGNDKERERVYDTIFRLPWRCELLIDFGFFVCLDSFLSLFTIMPTRIAIAFWRVLKTRQFQRPSSAELSDFGCFVVLVIGITLLQQADISLIYHMIRGQGVIKLYVVYNILEIFDKLCQSFSGDVMKALFNSADGLAKSSSEDLNFWLWRFILDEVLAVASSIIHSFILLAQAITLSTCIVAHNNALFAMLVSNNFAEIKSNVFKRYSKENVHSLVYFDSVERFHISAFVLFVLAQNILEAEGPWFESFISNAMVVYACEVMIDVIKHSFIAKFNDIKPIAFSEFLEDLCKQTLGGEAAAAAEDGKKRNQLTFVPLAPACVVIRVLRPVYSAHLPCGSRVWMLGMTLMMVGSVKVMVGMGNRKFARWYVKRCETRKLHSD